MPLPFDPVLESRKHIPRTSTSDNERIRKAISRTLNQSVQSIRQLDGHLYQTYRLVTADGKLYTLKVHPHYNARLLRQESDNIDGEAQLLRLIGSKAEVFTPKVVEHHTTTIPIGSYYLLTGPIKGTVLSGLISRTSSAQRMSIDKSLGSYVRSLSNLRAINFGSVRQIQAGSGLDSWSKAFIYLIETVLRDAEDALVSLPYDSIRGHVIRHRSALDRISEPQLVVLDAASPTNILVDENTSQMTGLLDYSHAVWGDPRMAECFVEPSEAFLRGFGRSSTLVYEGQRARQLLYALYRATVSVVQNCYRPRSDQGELEARRTLTSTLRQLDGV